MTAWWSGTGQTFLQASPTAIVNALAHRLVENHRTNHDTQLRAWHAQVAILRDIVARFPDWHVLLEYPLLRLGRRIDAVLLADRAIIVLEFKVGATTITQADRMQVEDYALDLVDFHAESRRHPVIPILVATEATPRPSTPSFAFEGMATQVIDASAVTLADTLADIVTRIAPPAAPLDGPTWDAAAYRPVPTIIEAATMLYSRHGVAEIAAARADTDNLSTTTQAILEAIARARGNRQHLAIFVTGIPGAGKTLCGLNVAFRIEDDTAFLTGNLPLLHVLREALARDAATQAGTSLRVARHKVESTIQALIRFLEHYVICYDEPHEHIIVFDEAQRAWDAAFGERKFNRRDSEAGLFLDIMARHRDFAVIVALVGNGQEINTGEAGLATWGEALARRPDWQIVAPADVIGHTDPARRLFDTPPSSLTIDPRLHLDVSLRQIRADAASAWIDAVLTGDEDTARRIAETEAGVPFLLSRSLTETRAALRHLARGTRRAGLVCSAGARRLRPEGLSCDFPHLDAKTVANWFLQNWPKDVRASDALELPATQFACQGLEFDYVGLCWDGDLIRQPGTAPWQARSFKGTRWQISRRPEEIAWRVNTYRVLLSRARYETVIFVPEGAPDDATRPPATYDAIADFLTRCGARNAATILQPDAEPAAPLQHALPAL